MFLNIILVMKSFSVIDEVFAVSAKLWRLGLKLYLQSNRSGRILCKTWCLQVTISVNNQPLKPTWVSCHRCVRCIIVHICMCLLIHYVKGHSVDALTILLVWLFSHCLIIYSCHPVARWQLRQPIMMLPLDMPEVCPLLRTHSEHSTSTRGRRSRRHWRRRMLSGASISGRCRRQVPLPRQSIPCQTTRCGCG